MLGEEFDGEFDLGDLLGAKLWAPYILLWPWSLGE